VERLFRRESMPDRHSCSTFIQAGSYRCATPQHPEK
jgi:hypothetical protein